MSTAQEFWKGLRPQARVGLAIGVMAIVAAFTLIGWLMLRTDYQVLFADLKPQDAQVMTTELERLKIPYRLGDAGTSILVDKSTVHATRIKLMGKDMALHGAVGLELFNNTDFGMTEFAQKINYQRALQGEITRTIQSLSEVRDVRVLLALPEQGLFKQATARAKASITLALRTGRSLRAEQVTGIQRLVAAAVPGMTTADVTIVDSQGLALTRAESGDGEADATSARLDIKRDTEAYLARKVNTVLEQAIGSGQALASVDVALNMDQVRVTTEDVMPAASRAGLQATGVIVREREVLRESGPQVDVKLLDGSRGGSSQRDVEYAVGRRVEQVVSQPGSIRRIHVVAVVRKALDAAQEEQLRKVVAAAAGAQSERGDTIVIQTLAAAAAAAAVLPAAPAGKAADAHRGDDVAGDEAAAPWWQAAPPPALSGLFVILVAGLLAFLMVGIARRRSRDRAPNTAARELSDSERSAALQRVRDWMDEGQPARPGNLPALSSSAAGHAAPAAAGKGV